jgi:hypothetical protein
MASVCSESCAPASFFDIDHETDNVIGNEFMFFFTKEEFKTIVRQYLNEHAEPRRRRTFFFRRDYDMAIDILRKENNTKIADSKQRSWVRNTFELNELGTPEHPFFRLIKKRSGIPVCPYDRVYNVLCTLHEGVHKHVGQRGMWDTVCSLLIVACVNNTLVKFLLIIITDL